ncbi:hypothetical protein [Novosphingobium sediminicola]|uniref:Uncharacterized protein n=1 Tax=Novosphingobium sediminicola TaxID=563162 RepID=A0A7W6CIM5_9SPHN|nr:hypothetical protein [Novosphingobium sediminicola]MBB3955103.1 hypothetical protein [Novosphingobium sediminicola]
MSKLTLRYRHDPSFFDRNLPQDDFGRLWIAVETDRFSGKGGFCAQWQDVQEFGEALARFPITEGQPVVAQWGFNLLESDDLIIRLEIAPADSRGNLAVRFEVADDVEPQYRARGAFLTNYPELATFHRDIGQLIKGEVEEAVLTGI